MSLFENAYKNVAAIVREFEEHHGEFLAHNYQESEVRTDFIDKFFTALGWDVAHREQTNPREREVKIEKSDTAGSTRRVDYAFYLKPDYRNPVFFCEAKKPSRDLNNADDYFQLVRYGYGASTPVGALTNFDEFHIIDCRYQPHIEKSYPSAQIKVFGYKDYLDKEAFGYIYWIFSREAVEAGKLKDFARSLPKQQGKGKAKLTAEEAKPVDEAFLTKLEEYRRILAKAFKKADENLNADVLTEATQKVIDRLVFIRFLEDKYIESDYIVDQIAAANHPLTPALERRGDENNSHAFQPPPNPRLGKAGGQKTPPPFQGGGTKNSPAFPRRGPGGGSPSAWKSFLNWSKELDVKYNGVVFKPHDIDKPEWHAPDDKIFADLCADISHTHSKYLFTYIPIELLGSIYERFLGKVVTTTTKRADIEDKPEVRKAGGVYYTPKYIVDYIVANTVGKILDGVREPGAGNREESILTTNKLNGKNTDKKLSRSPSVADGDGYDGRGIRPSGITPEGRTVRTTQSDESRGDLRSKQYSRGMGPDNEDLHLSSDGSVRITDGDRDTSIDSNAQEIPHSGTNSKILGVQLSDGSNAQPIDAVVGAGSGFRAPGTGVAPSPRTPEPSSRFPLTPKEISKLRFADIACGSGSFLIAVYDTVLHHVEKWYNDHPDDAKKAKCTEIEKGIFALSLKQKQQILLDNIFGVDIDRQAVEVAQLSLFLKLLESESGATVRRGGQLSFERTKILPDLSKNIQCGNSLVEYDILDQQTLFATGTGGREPGSGKNSPRTPVPGTRTPSRSPLTDEEEKRIKPFSFQSAFREIMANGGFDAIVGNPPYVQIYFGANTESLLPYFLSRYSTTEYQPNTSGLFMERCVRLLNSKGKCGLIIPNYWLSTNYDAKLRAFVFKTNKTEMLVNTYNVFIDASVDTVLLFVRRAENGEDRSFELRAVSRNLKTVEDRLKAIESGDWAFTGTQDVDPDHDIKPSFSNKITINAESKLEDYFYFRFGVKAYELGKGTPQQSKKIMEEKPYTAKTQVDKSFTKLLRASAVKHYELRQENDWIKYGENLAAPRDPEIFKGARILIQRIVSGTKFDATYVKEPYICNTDVITLKPFAQTTEEMLLYYLGIINSSLCSFYIRSVNVNLDRATYPKINTDTLMSFRVPKFEGSRVIPNLVNQMLAAKKQLSSARGTSEREEFQRKCDYLDGEIDRLVYALYGLTAEEIKIVEGNNP